MNILQILPELNVGGVETGTLDLSGHLVRLGHKVVVVSSGGELVGELEASGALHYQLPAHKKSLFTIIQMVSRLVEIIKKENIDIVHARSRVPAWSAYFACRSTGAVFITTCHGYYRKHYFSSVMGWGKRVIAISNVIGRHMIDDFGVSHERIRLVPRSVDTEKFKYTPADTKRREEFNVGIVGRITPIKGHLDFIKAMAKVYRIVPRLKIWVVGDAPVERQGYKEQIQVLTRRLGLAGATQFLGTQRDIPAIMSHLDLLILATTTHEAFGRVILEAQASGVPVVATRVGGVVDIIEDKKTGLLVPPADPNAMAEAALVIFKDKALASSLAAAAYSKVKEKYNTELMAKNTLSVYDDALRNFNILVIKTGSLGDVVISSAALRAIRNKFGVNYKISLLTGEECRDVLLRCPYIDELIVCDLKDKDKGLNGLFRLGGVLRKNNFDMVIDLQNNRKSHILSFLSWALKRYGYDNKKLGFLLNYRIKDARPAIDPVTHQFQPLKMLGIELNDPSLELWPSDEDARYIDGFLGGEWLSPNQKLVGINISASLRWPTKNWPLEHLAKFCQELAKRDLRIVITGTGGDLPEFERLSRLSKEVKFINACGKTTVNQLACLIKKCALYVSPDSASLHIAAAVKTPFIALFGATDPKRHFLPAENAVLINKDLECSPCYKTKCKTKRCMEQISPQEVLEAVDKLL